MVWDGIEAIMRGGSTSHDRRRRWLGRGEGEGEGEGGGVRVDALWAEVGQAESES